LSPVLSTAFSARSVRNRSADKPNEDAWTAHVGDSGAVFAVTDGVTHDRDAEGHYPVPSPGAHAAHLVARSLVYALTGPVGLPDVAGAFRMANGAIERVNRARGVWDACDYGQHDLWCAVATAVVIHGTVVTWGHVGDTFLLHLPAKGGLVLCTPDQVMAAEQYRDAPLSEARAVPGTPHTFARQFLRNKPDSPAPYYALTGETVACEHMATGTLYVSAGDRLALLSDGVVSLRSMGADGTPDWSKLETWLRLPHLDDAVDGLVAAVEEHDIGVGARSDDKTVLLAQFA